MRVVPLREGENDISLHIMELRGGKKNGGQHIIKKGSYELSIMRQGT